MNSATLEKFARLLAPQKFLGVFQPERLLDLPNLPPDSFFIVIYFNKHYTLFVKDMEFCGYFDSLKQSSLLENESFLQFLTFFCGAKLLTNCFKTQNASLYTCGYHVLYFIYLSSVLGKNFSSICENYFSKTTHLNERRILRFRKWIRLANLKPQILIGHRRLAGAPGRPARHLRLKGPF